MTQDEAIRDHSALVWHHAKLAYSQGIGKRLGTVADCAQVGFIGLLNAARLYDVSKGKFSTYATPAITNAIRTAATKCLIVYVPKYMQRQLWEHPSDCVMQNDARKAIKTAIVQGDTLNTTLDRDHWDGEFGDWEHVAQALRFHFPAKCQRLFQARYFEGKDFTAIGLEMGCSRQWVKDMHDRCIRKLRKLLSGEPGHVGASPAYPAAGKTSIR